MQWRKAKKKWIEGRKIGRWQEHEIKYIISLACLFNPWIWTSFVLQNLIIMNKKRKKSVRKSQWTCKKKKDELQKRLRRETKTSGSKISVNLGRETGEWRSTSLKKKKKVQNTWEPLQCVRETARHYWEGSS